MFVLCLWLFILLFGRLEPLILILIFNTPREVKLKQKKKTLFCTLKVYTAKHFSFAIPILHSTNCIINSESLIFFMNWRLSARLSFSTWNLKEREKRLGKMNTNHSWESDEMWISEKKDFTRPSLLFHFYMWSFFANCILSRCLKFFTFQFRFAFSSICAKWKHTEWLATIVAVVYPCRVHRTRIFHTKFHQWCKYLE